MAIIKNDIPRLNKLITKYKYDVNHINKYGFALIHAAIVARKDDTDVLEALIKTHHADVWLRAPVDPYDFIQMAKESILPDEDVNAYCTSLAGDFSE